MTWSLKKGGGILLFVCCVLLATIFLLDMGSVRTEIARTLFRNSYVREALFLHPNDAELLESIGNYYMGGEGYDIKKSEKAYTYALRARGKIFWSEYQLGRIAFVQGDFEQAHVFFEQALARNPENKRIIYARGVMYGYEGRWKEAESDFLEFIRWAPTEWGAYNDLAWVYAESSRFGESLLIAEGGIRTATSGSTNPWLWNAKGVAQFNLAMYEDAQVSFQNALTYAEKLTLDEWVRAYSANNPKDARGALDNFKNDITQNLIKSEHKMNGG